ncbi:unnamed protein product [Clonostachys byssicola]|uniref:Clr5 domain-containing protein n=1 Tax=Clonostachys byssicola TaxID=160290 RepID=A0A9N9U2L1_9HYPO|nr:unnamed protein product [Clonostachys byssicola]
MPAVFQKISKEQWEEYKPIIKRLHMDQGLPVKSKIGRPNLTQVMKHDHNFDATHSQYEAQLKRWGWVKNLSKEEWNLVLPLYHWLKDQQMDVRVKVSGRPLEKARLERGRRYVKTIFDGSLVPPPTDWLSMSDHHHITIETREANREWSQYPPRDHTGDMPEIGLAPHVNLLIDQLMLQDMPPQENIMGFENGTLVQATLNVSETAGAFPVPMVDSWFSTRQAPIPASSVVKLLKNEPRVYSTMHKLLLDAPALVAKPFAENLLKASVEAADAEAVQVIAGTMKQRGIKINPNELMCECDGRFLSLAECAGKLRSVELLQVLLRLGADPNKTFENKTDNIYGALEWALDVSHVKGVILEGEIEPSFSLVQMLVEAGAKVEASLLGHSAEWCRDSQILALMLQRITDDQHSELLKVLPGLIEDLDNDLGQQATQKLFQIWKGHGCQCGSSVCQDPVRIKNYLQKSLKEAINRQNFELCQLILSRTDPEPGAFVRAIRGGNRRMANLLIQHGACVSEGTDRAVLTGRSAGFTTLAKFLSPLGEAIRLQDPSILQWMEEQGAWAFVSDERYLESVAEAAADVGNVAVLERLFAMDVVRDRDSSPNFQDALEAATRKENIPIVKLLLDNGARPHGTMLEHALEAKNGELVRMILDNGILFPSDGATNDSTSRKYSCALERAIEWGNIKIIEELIHAKAHYSIPKQGQRGLCAAIKSGNAVLVDLLLSAGVSLDAQYNFHESSISNVVHRISPLSTAVSSGNEKMASHLLRKGADPADAIALSLAIGLDKTSLFRTLLTAFQQSYPVGRSDFGAEPLIRAIKKEGRPYVEELLEAKMNVNHLSQRHGRTPLGSAVERHGTASLEVVAKLLESGADPNAIARVDQGRNRNLDHWESPKTALLIAIEAGNEAMVELLLKSGADVNKEAQRGITRTPLQSACQRRSLPIVQLLLRWGADVNAPASSRNGGTALQLACLSGSIKIVRLLLSIDANLFGPTSAANGRSALENAAENGRLDVIKVLWDATGGCGFPAREVARAQRFARARGFPGCADYVAKLAEASLLDFSMTIVP